MKCCVMCGGDISNDKWRPKSQQTCGHSCGQKFRYLLHLMENDSIPVNTNKCVVCEKSLFGKGKTAKTCGNYNCKLEFLNHRWGPMEIRLSRRIEQNKKSRNKNRDKYNTKKRDKYKNDMAYRSKHLTRKHKRKAILAAVKSEPWQYSATIARCYWCGDRVKVGDAEIDHIVPISRGGSDLNYNRVFSCKRCNRAKYTKHPNSFIKNGQLVLCFDHYSEVAQ